MKILWIENKQDIFKELDRTTWIEMVKELTELGHTVQLILPSYGNKERFGLGKRILYLPTLKGKIIQSVLFSISLFIYSIYSIMFSKNDYVLFGYLNFYSLLPFIIMSRLQLIKTKFILDIRAVPGDLSTKVDEIKNRIYKFTINYSKYLINGFTVISAPMRNQICTDFNINPKIVGIWSSGVPKEFFTFNGSSSSKNTDNFTIMYHGIITNMRGLQQTVSGIEIIKTEIPSLRFSIMGHGKFLPELTLIIQKYKLNNVVNILPPVEHKLVPYQISQCDIGILPFPDIDWWNTSSPLKLFEYLALEKPVIVTDIQAHREVLNGSECCFFIKNNSPEEIADGIRIAYHNKKNLSNMGKKGKALIFAEYSWENQAKHLISFFSSIQ